MCHIWEAFPYADVFTSERLPRMRSVSIRGGIYIWKTAADAKRFHTRTHLHLKDGRVCEAFPYTEVFTFERLPRMRSVSIRGGIYIWKTAAYAKCFHMRTHLHLKSYRVCEAFPYVEVFTFERLQRMRCVSIRGHIYTWKTATYAMWFHTVLSVFASFSFSYSIYYSYIGHLSSECYIYLSRQDITSHQLPISITPCVDQ